MELDTAREMLGKIAYHAYGKTTEFKNYQGLAMPEWEALPVKIRIAWINAALAVANILDQIKVQI